MNWLLFWAYKDSVEELGGKGFSVFSLPHILWLLFCAAVITAIAVFYRRSEEPRRSNIRKGFALFLILFEIMKLCAHKKQLNQLWKQIEEYSTERIRRLKK